MARKSKKVSEEEPRQIIFNNKQIAENLYSKKILLRCKNEKQKKLVLTIDHNEITLCIRSSGTGKSHISVYKALQLLSNPDNNYQKIYIMTPIVEAEEHLGSLERYS